MSNNYGNQPARQIVVQSAKESWLAYLLWFLLGNLGVHKFYLKQNGMGFIYLGLSALGWLTVWFFVGFVFLIPLWIMMVIDLFTMPGRVRAVNQSLMRGY
ncbi:TM2 domain-containing protein [Arthrobacter sp. H5]|uniref:TM2 domain-containing protein n=1 Tax=Arthrobacter sp. H5 TaxID=1267973 RepID=UPI0004B4A675|nr:TM2 domain-containing protein [Arthrobacter sp. H5]